MLSLLALAPLALPIFSAPQPWALGFAPAGRLPMVGDINGDGFADLICVSPKGDCFIDVAVNKDGMKSLAPQRANSNWGKDCEAACVGEFDEVKGADVVGLFRGDTLRLAHAFASGAFKDEPEWVKLPYKLQHAHLSAVAGAIWAWDEGSGRGYKILPLTKTESPIKIPPHVAHIDEVIAGMGHAALFTYANGSVRLADSVEAKPSGVLGTCRPGVFPAVAHGWIFVDQPATGAPVFVRKRLESPYPAGPEVWAPGDMDGNGSVDLVLFRFGTEPHTGENVLLYRRLPADGKDAFAQTSGDGLLDSWKTKGFRGLDLKGMGCKAGQVDLICLVSRFANTNKEMVEATMKRVQGYYDSLGWSLHLIWLDPLSEADQKRPWQENRDMLIPAKWRGVVHFMQISPYGGGQADQLGDGGGCGGNDWALYATFIHEFGHQLGLSHEGFYQAAWCPTYPSMMNYAYSYGYEGDIKKIRYSEGALANYVLRETDLDETIPLPYEKVKFLEAAPYHYRLKPSGNTTLIDWNWNGIFGEKHVRADINYAYSTTAGRRDEVGKTQSAPWTFTHGRDGYVLYSQNAIKPDGKSDPSISPEKPGWLMMRKLVKPYEWAEPVKVAEDGVAGDPVAVSYRGEIVIAYPTLKGVAIRWIKSAANKIQENQLTILPDAGAVPSLGLLGGRLILFEWARDGGTLKYRSLSGGGHTFSEAIPLRDQLPQVADHQGNPTEKPQFRDVTSTVPVGLTEDTDRHELLLALAQDQDKDRTSRWELWRYRWLSAGLDYIVLNSRHPDLPRQLVEGEKGGPRGRSRLTVLYDAKGLTGMKGRVLIFGQGMTSAASPWSCEYVAQTVADKTVGNGWMVKRYYDEWTQSRSAPAACWFGGDILYSYRWADGSQGDRDNVLHVAYNGTGIEDVPMGDFDDIGFMKAFGIRHSLLYLRE